MSKRKPSNARKRIMFDDELGKDLECGLYKNRSVIAESAEYKDDRSFLEVVLRKIRFIGNYAGSKSTSAEGQVELKKHQMWYG